MDYKEDLNQRFWAYQKSQFPKRREFFDQPGPRGQRPPVFRRCKASQNVIADPKASRQETDRLLALVPETDRHRWFRSMKSSQALAQSVLGNLAIHGFLNFLAELDDDEGNALIGKAQITSDNFAMEFKIDYLGERPNHQTSLDGYVCGNYRIALECKFTEAEVGTCSRPGLTLAKPNYETQHCDGTYAQQKARKERCSLTEIGVSYWRHVPKLFRWRSDADLNPCPLYKNYQLVRNILAIGVKRDNTVSTKNGHVVLVYDERNPAFQTGGTGLASYVETQSALLEPTMLQKCSWQRIIQHIRDSKSLPWLTEHLARKYGL